VCVWAMALYSSMISATGPNGEDMESGMGSCHNSTTSLYLPRPQGTPRSYLTAVEKNREKAWDHCYVTDRKWWTWLVQIESTLRTN